MTYFSKILYTILLAILALPSFTFAQEEDGWVDVGSSSAFPDPVRGGVDGEITTLFTLVDIIIENVILPIGTVVLIFFIIIAGFLFVTARGNKDQIEKAKNAFFGVVVGGLILLGSLAISQTLENTTKEIDNALDSRSSAVIINHA
jgi:hypothetical protein